MNITIAGTYLEWLFPVCSPVVVLPPRLRLPIVSRPQDPSQRLENGNNFYVKKI